MRLRLRRLLDERTIHQQDWLLLLLDEALSRKSTRQEKPWSSEPEKCEEIAEAWRKAELYDQRIDQEREEEDDDE